MPVIWKFDVMPEAFEVEMPTGARILSVACQPGPRHIALWNQRLPEEGRAGWAAAGPRLWALVEPSAPPVKRRFVTVATGQPLPDEVNGFAYAGTFMFHSGQYVFHLFDAGEP